MYVNNRANVFIAAMGRSGSTILANKLTRPPESLVFIEPHLAQGGNINIVHGMKLIGRDFDEKSDLKYLNEVWKTNPDQYTGEFFRKLGQIDFWGFKEVEPWLFEPSVQIFNPLKIIILVRDLEQVFYSYYEKSFRQNKLDNLGIEWIERRIKRAADAQLNLLKKYPDITIVVNYNQKNDDTYLKDKVFSFIGFNGGVDGGIGHFGFQRRSWEIERNKNRASLNLSPSDRGIPEDLVPVAGRIKSRLSVYREVMGI